MKRTVAVCLMAGVMLAMSTAAFATPLPAWDVTYTSSAQSLVNDTQWPGNTITWFQPYDGKLNPADPLYAGGTLTQAITSATLTVVAKNVAAGDIEPLSIQSPSTWESLGNLKSWTLPTTTYSSTTVFGWPTGASYNLPLAGATGIDWLAGTNGFNAKVVMTQPSNLGDTVTSSTLVVTTHYTWTPNTPTEPPTNPVPAPGAILLASMGAGLVSWLRARKSL